MFTILINDILPVFAVLVLGFILGKTNVVSQSEAATLNRVAFILLQPPLISLLLSQVNLDVIDFNLNSCMACIKLDHGQAH